MMERASLGRHPLSAVTLVARCSNRRDGGGVMGASEERGEAREIRAVREVSS